jgi:hypothetical protein
VQGFEVARLDLGYPLNLLAAAAEGRRFKVQLNGAFTYRDADGTDRAFDAEQDHWEDWVPLFALRGDTIERAHVSAACVLTIDFSSGRAISVTPTEDGYEAWEAKGPGFKMVDGPALWTGSAWD